MRYLGEVEPFPLPALPGGLLPSPSNPQAGQISPLSGLQDPVVRSRMMQLAPDLSETDGEFFADFADATKVGGKRKLVRLGIGAAVGLAVGFGLCKLIGG